MITWVPLVFYVTMQAQLSKLYIIQRNDGYDEVRYRLMIILFLLCS